MKDIRITYTYHKKNFDLDEEPTTGTIVLPVEDAIAAELLLAVDSRPSHRQIFPLRLRDAFVVLFNALPVYSGR